MLSRRWPAAAVALTGLALSTGSASAEPTELTEGTYFFNATVADGTFRVGLAEREGTTSNYPYLTAEDPVIRVSSSRTSPVPEDPRFAWLGEAGTPTWRTREVLLDTEPGAPSIYLATRGLTPSSLGVDPLDAATGKKLITLALSDVVGPTGATFMWYGTGGVQLDEETGSYVPQSPNTSTGTDPRFGTGAQRDGTPQSRVAKLGGNSSQSGVMRFTAEGMYCVTVRGSATLVSGQAVSARSKLKIAVGDAIPASAPCGATAIAPTVVGDGHIDVFAPHFETVDGQRTLRLRAKTNDASLAYDDFVLAASDAAKQTLPDAFTPSADYSFIGAPGQTVWVLPSGQLDGLPWAGSETGAMTGLGPAGWVSWRIDAVTGAAGAPAPGDVALWSLAPAGSQLPLLSTRGGLPSGMFVPGAEVVGGLTHNHFKWAFTNPGVYCLAFTAEAQPLSGPRQRDSRQLTVVVGNQLDPATVLPCGRTQEQPHAALEVERAAPGTTVMHGGFALMTPRVQAGRLQVGLRQLAPLLDGPGVTHEIEDVVLHQSVVPRSHRKLTAKEWIAPTGTYVAPIRPLLNVADPQRFLHLGWDATQLAPEALDGDLTWTLDRVDGPGWVATTFDAFHLPVIFDSRDPAKRSFALWPGTMHDTVNWAFSQSGKYCLHFRWAGTLPSGEAVSDEHTLTLVLDGPLDPAGDDTSPQFIHDANTLVPCGRETSEPDPDPTPAPTATPTPTPTATPEATPLPSASPAPTPVPDDVAKPAATLDRAISATRARTIRRGGLVAIATIACPRDAETCRVTVPKRTRVSVAGKRYTLPVFAPKTVAAGRKATVRVRLTSAAAKRLRGRRATLRLSFRVTAGALRSSRTAKVTLKGAPKPKRAR